jgi:hypothetical protein
MDLITFLFPKARAAQAAKEAADQLAEHQQSERLKALAALLQSPLDEQTRARVEEAFQSELAKLLPPPPLLLFKGSGNWQRKAGLYFLGFFLFCLIVVGLIVVGPSHCTGA